MAKKYHVGPGQRAANAVFRELAARGWGHPYLHVLSVTGRRSGVERSVPVDVMDLAGRRYLVAPYGEVNWVRNLRVAGTAKLRRGRSVATYDAVEVDAAHAMPVIRQYVHSVPVTKDYWDIDDRSSDEDVLAEAHRHPVFRLSHR
ncbi:MAG: nitroreductase/quinone reductase family protein [Allobranchiibius sp.]